MPLSNPTGKRAVFLDRDGVINRVLLRDGKPYPPTSCADFVLLPGVAEACARLKAAGFLLIVATNQPDVGRGTLAKSLVESMHDQMCHLLPIDRVEVSYDSGRESPPSEFRKPRPGMLLRAAHEFGVELPRSFMVGDRWRDIDCGHAAGCATIFIEYNYAEELRQQPDYRVRSLQEAADLILGLGEQPPIFSGGKSTEF
jgi:D-glycero-D-manno-heptose 1,7-bisphosphate phosphatase